MFVVTCLFLVPGPGGRHSQHFYSSRKVISPALSFPVFRFFLSIFLVGKASLRQLTAERRPNPNQNSVVDDDVERDIHPTRTRHDARGVGPLLNPLARPPVYSMPSPRPPYAFSPPSLGPSLPPPFFLLLAPELPKKKMVRPPTAVRSFFPSRFAQHRRRRRPRLLSTCERELAPWPRLPRRGFHTVTRARVIDADAAALRRGMPSDLPVWAVCPFPSGSRMEAARAAGAPKNAGFPRRRGEKIACTW